MYEMRIKAPKNKSLLVEVGQPIDTDTAELVMVGHQIRRFFIPASEKLTLEVSPGDDVEVGEFHKGYRTLDELVEAETAKRERETRRARVVEALMPEVAERPFGEGTYEGEEIGYCAGQTGEVTDEQFNG
jgi:hypothetical protein